MPLPDRPVDGAEIATDWGQAVHDYTFAPTGAVALGGPVTCTSTPTNLPIDVAINDPGGWVDIVNNRLVAPAGADGLYIIMAVFNAVSGTANDTVRGIILLNGTQVITALADSDGGVHVVWNAIALVDVSAGDVFTFQSQKRGSGANPSVQVQPASIIRIGAELGA
jgi:hypothetical protein